MKRAVILHALEQDSGGHWYPWLKAQLEQRGYAVWVPDLPMSHRPDAVQWTDCLLSRKDWDFTDNLVIGHSAGAVEVLQLAQALPEGVQLKAAVMASAFSEVLPQDDDWAQLKGLFSPPLNFAKIKAHAQEFLFVHGSDDPWCPLEQAEYLAKQTGGELVLVHGGGHFSTSLDPRFTMFHDLIEILDDRAIL